MAASTDSQTKWFTLTAEAVAQQLKVDPTKGLSTADAQQRLQQYGANELAAKKKESGLAGFSAPVPGLYADHSGGRGGSQRRRHGRMGHDNRASAPDGLQRRCWHCAAKPRPQPAWQRYRAR